MACNYVVAFLDDSLLKHFMFVATPLLSLSDSDPDSFLGLKNVDLQAKSDKNLFQNYSMHFRMHFCMNAMQNMKLL